MIALIAALSVVVLRSNRSTLDISEHLDDTAVEIDGEAVTFKVLGYYIMETEEYVDLLAQIYDATDTHAFWRIHTNGSYVITQAKDSAMNTCIRDEVYALEAAEAGISLDAAETAEVATEAAETYEGLSYKQQKALEYNVEDLEDILTIVHLARKYANYVLEEVDLTGYNQSPEVAVEVDGEYYEEVLATHEVEINTSLWKRVSLGGITIQKVQ
ncbi:MAG: hypothetical protein K5840_02510 [Eubacterium sp.]|nr:hypothetical protein [Eubacterium sp.]